MVKRFALVLALLVAGAAQAQSPPGGDQMLVQSAKTSNYTVTSKDLRTIIPMNCSSGCTVTLPTLSSSFPKGYQVLIQMVGSGPVTISSGSTIYGVSLSSGNIVLSALGSCTFLTADPTNKYFATPCGGSSTPPSSSGLGLYAGGTLGLYSGGSLGLY